MGFLSKLFKTEKKEQPKVIVLPPFIKMPIVSEANRHLNPHYRSSLFVEYTDHLKYRMTDIEVTRYKLAMEILRWMKPLFDENKIVEMPKFTYRNTRKVDSRGVYLQSSNREIFINLNYKSETYLFLKTYLHEIRHFMQHHFDPDQFSKYKEMRDLYGYENNPFEVDARAFADAWTTPLMIHLININYISIYY